MDHTPPKERSVEGYRDYLRLLAGLQLGSRLRAKLEYTTIGFQLLAHEFTMSELQEVYQAILNRKLDKRNFRKKLLLMRIVEPTSHTKMVGPHRPAQLFRFNPRVAQ